MALEPKDRIPPHSLEMEQATLGSMLIERVAIETASEILQPEDFYRDVHGVIFEAILSLTRRDEPVDILTVQEHLSQQDVLEIVGGPPYLLQCMDSVVAAANVAHYARIVEEKAILRRLLDASSQVQALAYSEFDDIAEVVDKAEKAVFGVAHRRIGSYFTHMKPLIETVYEQIEFRSENKSATTGLPTPFDKLNFMTAGLQPSDLIIVAARPSMGKTALVLGMGQHAALRHNKSVAIFSLEMSKEQLCLRMICSEARVDAQRLRSGYLEDDDWPRVGNTCSKLSDAPIYIDDSPDCSALEIRAKCRRLMAEKGLGMVIVDYLQLMRGHKRTENRTQEIAEIARSLKSLARELKVPVVALSQLSRAVEQRPDKRPMLSDLRESGSIEAEADIVMFIYRDSYYKAKEARTGEGAPPDEQLDADGQAFEEAELIVAKQRNGPTGKVVVAFHPQYARFDNLKKDYDRGYAN
ncbi:MAG: replicative DNA helicase [Chthonomonadales bacterium]